MEDGSRAESHHQKFGLVCVCVRSQSFIGSKSCKILGSFIDLGKVGGAKQNIFLCPKEMWVYLISKRITIFVLPKRHKAESARVSDPFDPALHWRSGGGGGGVEGGRAGAAAAATSNGRIFRSMEGGEAERRFRRESVSQSGGEITAGKSKWTKTLLLFLLSFPCDFSKQIAE